MNHKQRQLDKVEQQNLQKAKLPICHMCRKHSRTVHERPDYYDRDIHNREGAMHTVCDSCNRESDNDI